jgi:hypothetical protein
MAVIFNVQCDFLYIINLIQQFVANNNILYLINLPPSLTLPRSFPLLQGHTHEDVDQLIPLFTDHILNEDSDDSDDNDNENDNVKQ